jgi:bifunctional DNA-binding transcriptional regulator/antitoxin component of YhaV-PrlF toxin-antitoxin module
METGWITRTASGFVPVSLVGNERLHVAFHLIMFREFQTTVIDDQGHFDVPADIRARIGLRKGTLLQIEEHGKELVVHPLMTDSERKERQLAAIDALTGFLPKESKVLETLLDERKKDRERENRSFGI